MMNLEEEMRATFIETFTEEYLNHVDNVSGDTRERLWMAYCHGFANGAESVTTRIKEDLT